MRVVIYAWTFFRIPLEMVFDGFASHDSGANLSVMKLLAVGLRDQVCHLFNWIPRSGTCDRIR